MRPIKIVFAALLASLILAIVLFVLLLASKKISNKKHTHYVFHKSEALRNLLNINKTIRFHKLEDVYENHTYDSKDSYENISCKDYLVYQLQFASSKVRTTIKKAKENALKYKTYKKRIEKEVVPFQIEECLKGFNLKKIQRIEDREIAKRLQFPNKDFIVQITIHQKGTFKYKKEMFHQDELISLLNRISRKRADNYLDKEIRNSIAKVEVAKVSNSLKESIFARDNHVCLECGAKENLAIDHITPVLKKGKTEPKNLQTLCIYCKAEKENMQ